VRKSDNKERNLKKERNKIFQEEKEEEEEGGGTWPSG
jgi:hypothetical protein